jgi:exonuclease SbcD
LLVDVTDGHVSGVPRRLLVDHARWASLTVNLSGAENEPEALRAISNAFSDAAAEAEGRLLAARVKLIGATKLHRQLKADASRFADDVQAVAHHVHEDLWVELLRIETTDTTIAGGASSLDPAALLEGLEHDAIMRQQAADVIATVTAKLPGGITVDEISLTDDVDAVLADARALVLGRLAPKQDV